MQNKIIIVIGPKGSGKTYAVCQAIAHMDRVAIFDMVHEVAYAEAVEEDEDKQPPDNAIIVGQPKAFTAAISQDRERFKVVYRPVNIEPLKNGLVESDEFGPIVKCVYLRGDMWLVIDEAHLLCNSHNCPRELMIASLLGRHRRMNMVLVAQSFTGIHPALRKNADEFMFWRIIEPSDLDAIKDRCGKDVAEKVSNLRILERNPKTDKLIRPGQMLRWDKLNGVVEITNQTKSTGSTEPNNSDETEPELERDRR